MGTTVQSKHAAATVRDSGEAPDQESDRRATVSRAYLRAHRNIRRHGLRDARRLFVLIGADLATFGALWWVLHWLREGLLGSSAAAVTTDLFSPGFLGGRPQFAVALVLSLYIVGAYGAGQRRRDTGRVLAGVALAALISLFDVAWRQPFPLTALRFAATMVVVTPALVAVRLAVDRVVRAARGRNPVSRAILVAHGDGDVDAIKGDLADVREFAIADVVRLGTASGGAPDIALASLADLIERTRADTVVLWADLSQEEFAWTVDLALACGCRLLAVPRAPGAVAIQPKSVWVDGRSFVELTVPRLQAWQLAAKRVVDIVGATTGLIVLSPLFLALALAIKLDSPGPVSFRQRRMGRGGKPFEIFKFRSMVRDAEQRLEQLRDRSVYSDSRLFKMVDDPRMTRVGRVLRRTSLDELPQLVNVLLGHMSLVGPRPPIPSEVAHYEERHYRRFTMKPGITGPWQVNGRNSITDFEEVVDLESRYIRSWSILADLRILLRTVPVVFSRNGAH